MVHRARWWSAIVVCVLGFPAGAGAEPCTKLEAAIVAAPTDIPTMLDLGRCNEKLGKLAQALRWYRAAQSTSIENKAHDSERLAAESALTIVKRVPLVVLEIEGTTDAKIEIDGSEISPTTYTKIELDPGDHQIVGHAAGRRAVRVAFRVEEGERETVKVAFVEPATPVYTDSGRGRRRAGLVVGVLGLTLFAGTAIYELVERRNFFDAVPGSQEERDVKIRARIYGTTGFVLSVGAVITGVILYVTAPGKTKVSDGTALVPVIGDSELGFSLAGRF